MKFINEEPKVVSAGDAIDLNPKKDQIGIEGTNQAVEPKPVEQPALKESWKDGTVKTLVNLRKIASPSGDVLTTVKGGDIVKISSLNNFGDFYKVKYKKNEGYIKKEFCRFL